MKLLLPGLVLGLTVVAIIAAALTLPRDSPELSVIELEGLLGLKKSSQENVEVDAEQVKRRERDFKPISGGATKRKNTFTVNSSHSVKDTFSPATPSREKTQVMFTPRVPSSSQILRSSTTTSPSVPTEHSPVPSTSTSPSIPSALVVPPQPSANPPQPSSKPPPSTDLPKYSPKADPRVPVALANLPPGAGDPELVNLFLGHGKQELIDILQEGNPENVEVFLTFANSNNPAPLSVADPTV